MQRVRVAGRTPEPANRWFEQRRDFHMRTFYSRVARTYEDFVELYQGQISKGTISFDALARLVGNESRKGPLWQLKDHCHHLFRESANPTGRHLDRVIGSIFHEAMKLKENIYLYRFYGPAAEELSRSTAPLLHGGLSREKFRRKILKEAGHELDNLALLFCRVNFLLRLLLPDQSQNVLLLRLLIEEKRLGRLLWGESVTEIFSELFPDQAEHGYLAAAKSYFDAQWLHDSLAAYEKALQLNSSLAEARRRTFLIRTMISDRDRMTSS
mgnify:CR=1 FL=1